MTDQRTFAGLPIAALLRTLVVLSLSSACSEEVEPDTGDAEVKPLDADSAVYDSDDTTDTTDTTEVDVFRCTTDPECVAVIGGVSLCERAACNTLTGQCVRTAQVDGTPCSDRDACTPNDTCRSARCIGLGVTDCDDGNPCTADRCEPRTGCLHTPNEASCDDDDRCTERDRCEAGLCVGAPTDCDDDDPCTLDRCDRDLGCIYRAVDPCPTGDPG